MPSERHLNALPSLRDERAWEESHRPRRPGERREPFAAVQPTEELAVAGADRGLCIATAFELVAELALVRRDLSVLYGAAVVPLVLDIARAQVVEAAVPPAFALYLRALSSRRSRVLNPIEMEEPLDLPLRLIGRVQREDIVMTEAMLEDAITLERAALVCGRTMSEYALITAARVHITTD